jgi:glutamate 5-kinase
MFSLGIRRRPKKLGLMQATAAVGQSRLMHTYERLLFGKKVVAQLLLSSDDFSSPLRYQNLCKTLHQLLRMKVLPIVNENDSVSVRELEGAFGDNDELSALVASALGADWLILLTDVDGFFRSQENSIWCGASVASHPGWKLLAAAKASLGVAGCAPSCGRPLGPRRREFRW